ncbi:hypothetical protein J3459_006122 [Metarhizium acridum]|nr:hypothetical protein J3459_006122 [Metarhizium acridum]
MRYRIKKAHMGAPTNSRNSNAKLPGTPTRGTPLAPHEVLFRRKDAPERYAEHDVYNAHERDLPQGGRDILPHSDLLKSVHAYSSKFYGAMERRRNEMNREAEAGGGAIGRRSVDERSMDETACSPLGSCSKKPAGRSLANGVI